MTRYFKDHGEFVGRVLLVEDDLVFSEWLGLELSKNGIECISEESFLDAQKHLEEENASSIHAVIADLYLNDQNPSGFELVQKARDLEVPVCVITSKLDLEVARRLLDEPTLGFFEKPFEPQRLFSMLWQAWHEPKYLSVVIERSMEIASLTKKEKEVCKLIFKGLSNKEIANTLNVSEKTIKFHVTSIFNKFEVGSRSELQSQLFPT